MSAPRLVFIHGAGCTPAAFGDFPLRFADSRAVALPGRPGGAPVVAPIDSAAPLRTPFRARLHP